MEDEKTFDKFKKGNIVIKIMSDQKQETLPIQYCHLEKYMNLHKYTPLLYKVSGKMKIAYIFECLNREYQIPRDKTFTVWERTHKSREDWNIWFVIEPYID